VLAQAQFAQANFSGAAAAYRKILDAGFSLPEFVTSYAQALAAADRKDAGADFQRWADSVKDEKPREVEVSSAGLDLLAGHPEAAHKLEIALQQSDDSQTPGWIGELGWWHYLNGDYQRSVELLSAAVQQRPGDLDLRIQLAWTQIEIRRYGDALQSLNGIAYEQDVHLERAIVRAVANWQAQEHDEAMHDFDIALEAQPEWENSNWVKAIYSPLVAQSIQQMRAERERRRQKMTAAASQ
jgi:tetratricopeptide (TPR) repeat protein